MSIFYLTVTMCYIIWNLDHLALKISAFDQNFTMEQKTEVMLPTSFFSNSNKLKNAGQSDVILGTWNVMYVRFHNDPKFARKLNFKNGNATQIHANRNFTANFQFDYMNAQGRIGLKDFVIGFGNEIVAQEDRIKEWNLLPPPLLN